MGDDTTFLTTAETIDFDQAGWFIKRHVLDQFPGTKSGEFDLTDAVAEVVRRRKENADVEGAWFEAFCVEVPEGDGMTWSAERLRRDLADRFPNFQTSIIANERGADELPRITAIVGEDWLLRAAVKLKLAPSYFSFRSWQSAASFFAVVLLTSITQLGTILVKRTADMKAAFFSPALYGVLALYAVVAVLLQWLLATKFRTRDASVDGFRKKMDGDELPANVNELADRVALELSRNLRPRFVIIDGYDSLDELSQRSIQQYLERDSGKRTSADCWIIFEAYGSGGLAARFRLRSNAPGFRRMRLYDQVRLTDEQRTKLAQFVKAPERAVFTTVKQISRFGGGDDEWIAQLIPDYAKNHGGVKSSIAYLYFLALENPDVFSPRREAPIGGSAYFSWSWMASSDEAISVRSVTAEKSGVRANILAAFFGETLNTRDVDRFAQDIGNDLRRFLHVRPKDATQFYVVRDVAHWMIDHAGELKLPDPGIAKLYWALLLWEKKARDVFWSRRAAHHLLEANLGAVAKELRAEIVPVVRELYFGLINLHVARCYLVDVDDLIESAANTFIDFDAEREKSLARLLPIAWRVYHVTGSARVLASVLTISERLTATPEAVAAPSPLQHLFAQSCRLPEYSRSLLEVQLGTAVDDDLVSTRDHAIVNAAWTTAVGAPFLYGYSNATGTHGIFEFTEVDRVLLDVIERTSNRVAANPARVQVLDIASLSTAVWTLALELHPALLMVPVDGEGMDAKFRAAAGRVERLVESAERVTTAVAAYLGDGGGKQGSMIDYLGQAMVNDACATALSALWMLRRAMGRDAKPRPLGDREVRLIRDIENALGTEILREGYETSDDAETLVTGKVEESLRACAMTWQRFGLDRMSILADVRRVHFSFAARAIPAHDYARHHPLLQSISAILRDRDSGIVANLSIAQCVSESAELVSYYLAEAAQLAIDNDFGQELQSTLALIAALHASEKESDRLRRCLELLTQPQEDGTTTLARYLTAVPEDEVMGPVLRLSAAFSQSESPELDDAFEATVTARMKTVRKAEVLEQLGAMLDLRRVRSRIRKGESIDAAAVLAGWSQRREAWAYPSLLNSLIDNGYATNELREDAVKLLQRDPNSDHVNSWYHLALCLAADMVPNDVQQAAVPLRYIEKTVSRWEDLEIAENNALAYRLLARLHVAKRPEYVRRHGEWQAIIVQRDHLQRLPALAQLGKYFLIFEDYVEHMRDWGLPLTVPESDYVRRRNLPPPTRVRAVTDWRRDGATVPPAFSQSRNMLVVNAEFVLMGTLFFTPPVENNDAYDDDRRRFNAEAKSALPALIDEIRKLAALPMKIRTIIEQYSQQFIRRS